MPQHQAPKPDGRVSGRRGRRRGRTWQPSELARQTAVLANRLGVLTDLDSPHSRQVLDAVVTALRSGNYLDTAAALAGCHPDSLKTWLRDGSRDTAGQTPAGKLWARISAAMAEAEAVDVARMTAAAKRDWRAAAWVLERRWPERWSQKLQHHVQAPAVSPGVTVWNLALLTIPQLEALLGLAQHAAGQDQAQGLAQDLAGAVAGNGHGNGHGPGLSGPHLAQDGPQGPETG